MRLRKQALGNRNLIGARVELARKNQGMKQKELLAQLQVNGVDMNASGLSKLEGQIRYVTDFELAALARILNVSVELARKNQGMKQKELLAQLQVNGVDMNASGLSKLEGQIRYVTDFELAALARILNVSVDWLLGLVDEA